MFSCITSELRSFHKKDNIVATSKNRHNLDSRLSLNLFWCVSFPRNKKSFREEKTPKRKTTNTEKKRGNRHQCSRIDREPLSRAHRWPAIASAFIKKEGRFSEDFCFFFSSSFVSNQTVVGLWVEWEGRHNGVRWVRSLDGPHPIPVSHTLLGCRDSSFRVAISGVEVRPTPYFL